MRESRKRILFLCATRSLRAQMAASILVARARAPWDVWSTLAVSNPQDDTVVRQVLDEIGIALLTSPQTSEPAFGLSWEEGIILCSGLAAT